MTAPDAAGLTCPLCGYDLRGLTEPRCPECGSRLDWDALRRRHRHDRRLLFERVRGHELLDAFWCTQWQAWRPQQLWRRLSTDDGPARPGRLALYWALANLPLALGTAVLFGIALDVVGGAHPPVGSAEFNRYFRSFGTSDSHLSPCAVLAAGLCWVPLSWAALRAVGGGRIAGRRLVRAAVYGCDVSLLLGAAEVGLFMFTNGNPLVRPWMARAPATSTAAVLVGAGAIVSRRLTFACRDYLQVDRSVAVAVASQAMVVLAIGAAVAAVAALV